MILRREPAHIIVYSFICSENSSLRVWLKGPDVGSVLAVFAGGLISLDRDERRGLRDGRALVLALAIGGWAGYARLVRAQVMSVRDREYVDAARALGARVAGLPCLVVDHHSSGEAFGDARMVDPRSPSTTMLVFALFEALGVVPDAATAQLLLFGLCTDTGFFRHLSQNGAETFEALSRLVQRGTSTAEVYMMVYGRRELSGRKLLAEMLSHAESHLDDALIITWQTIEERTRLSSFQRGEDDLYRLLQTVKGNVAVALIKEEREGAYSVGLRSSSAVDVGVVAASFGGGGHKQAAGFDTSGTLETVKQKVRDTLLPLVAAARRNP